MFCFLADESIVECISCAKQLSRILNVEHDAWLYV